MTEALSTEEQSKDRYFQSLAKIAEEMIDDHGKDFATGALILAAQWIAQGRIGKGEDAMH
ncbi:hypothetical protein [Ponticoccus alexandrii]|uniref:Uncharacterized protein n=1 Tax=Ponticoccus alexandrii TaxID=1943633 RepID=A0ABX7FGD1_9RHOB|nr:hypothetical protein [Ponticoccus alexandrii]ETA52078.1 hypothetical protein P279_10650 [Rhodobacteraceae bacterium PD-2]QRF69146.1 hypothetical protein GQA70_22635 [Ponticoccus alexandrii]